MILVKPRLIPIGISGLMTRLMMKTAASPSLCNEREAAGNLPGTAKGAPMGPKEHCVIMREWILQNTSKTIPLGLGGGLVSIGKNCSAETTAKPRKHQKTTSLGLGGGLVSTGKTFHFAAEWWRYMNLGFLTNKKSSFGAILGQMNATSCE